MGLESDFEGDWFGLIQLLGPGPDGAIKETSFLSFFLDLLGATLGLFNGLLIDTFSSFKPKVSFL